jgi:hypothetical protein
MFILEFIYGLICFIVACIFVKGDLSEKIVAAICCFICTPIFGVWLYRKISS